MFNYASQNYPVALGSGSFIFSVVTQRLLRTLSPIISVLDRFIILLLLITLAVALILITLILLENRNVILLFKSLGYRKSEVNNYITMGYIVSTILALILGVVIAYEGIRLASGFLVTRLQISLFFV
jgi:predicted lysophospholipase L1 biosynthesis ABC-type transport system permease subunit